MIVGFILLLLLRFVFTILYMYYLKHYLSDMYIWIFVFNKFFSLFHLIIILIFFLNRGLLIISINLIQLFMNILLCGCNKAGYKTFLLLGTFSFYYLQIKRKQDYMYWGFLYFEPILLLQAKLQLDLLLTKQIKSLLLQAE